MRVKTTVLLLKKPILWISVMTLMMLLLAACQPRSSSTSAPGASSSYGYGGGATTQAAATTPASTTASGAVSATEVPTYPAGKPAAGATTAYGATSAVGSAVIPSTGGEATINVAIDPKLGQILVDGKGMTLYVFLKDGPDQSTCAGSCAQTWPPLLTQGNPTLGQGVNSSLVGSATLANGSKIATYNKMPLYYFSKDTKPGDTNGQGIGGVWYVVAPSGQPVK